MTAALLLQNGLREAGVCFAEKLHIPEALPIAPFLRRPKVLLVTDGPSYRSSSWGILTLSKDPPTVTRPMLRGPLVGAAGSPKTGHTPTVALDIEPRLEVLQKPGVLLRSQLSAFRALVVR